MAAAPHVPPSLAAPLDPERRLAELARAGAPLRRVIAALAGRLVTTRGWERLGYARVGDYARERLGRSARSLQELARVDRRLAELPRLEAAFVSGRLPWSKLRLLARFVTPENESGWIARARREPVRALERAVRAVARGSIEAGALATNPVEPDAEPSERLRLGAPASLAFKWQRTRRYAAKVAGERIPDWVALEMITAEVVSALPLEEGIEADESPAEGAA